MRIKQTHYLTKYISFTYCLGSKWLNRKCKHRYDAIMRQMAPKSSLTTDSAVSYHGSFILILLVKWHPVLYLMIGFKVNPNPTERAVGSFMLHKKPHWEIQDNCKNHTHGSFQKPKRNPITCWEATHDHKCTFGVGWYPSRRLIWNRYMQFAVKIVISVTKFRIISTIYSCCS